jgi:cell division protease FtsH
VEKRPRITAFNDFGGRTPSDKPPIKTAGELAKERGEPWPQPEPEPAFKAAIARASAEAAEAERNRNTNGPNGNHGTPVGQGAGGRGAPPRRPTQPDYGAPAGWRAPGWPPQQPNYWYPPPPSPPQSPYWPQPPQHYPRQPYPPSLAPGESPPADKSPDQQGEHASRRNPPAHG